MRLLLGEPCAGAPVTFDVGPHALFARMPNKIVHLVSRERRMKKFTALCLVAGLAGGAFVTLPSAEAESAKTPKIGFLSSGLPSPTSPNVQELQQGLRDRGYVEGQNIDIRRPCCSLMK